MSAAAQRNRDRNMRLREMSKMATQAGDICSACAIIRLPGALCPLHAAAPALLAALEEGTFGVVEYLDNADIYIADVVCWFHDWATRADAAIRAARGEG